MIIEMKSNVNFINNIEHSELKYLINEITV